MHYFYETITLDVQNEHNSEHNLEHKTLFSDPKIYDADGDLSKRWYVYFTYRNPKTGKQKRAKNIYGKVNRYKTKEARYSLLTLYRKRLLKLLNDGYSPFEENNEQNRSQEEKAPKEIRVEKVIPKEIAVPKVSIPEKPKGLDIKAAFEQAINLKTNVVSPRTLRDYKNYCDLFERWLEKKHPEIVYIEDVGKKTVNAFLNDKQLETSARNRNNYRTCLSTIFQILEDNEIIDKNFVKSISVLKTNPERNRTYTLQQEEDIFKHLEEKDTILLLFIKFISYNFLRPIEVCRLRVKDINVEEQFLEIKVKNKPLKKKIIPEILLKELPDLKNMDGDMLLFTPEAIGAHWDTELTNRRDFFSKRFKSIVKDPFDLGKNYGLYSFRHTFITKLYRALANESSPHIAKSQLMQITGHSTMMALEKYLRDIDAELPEDYSKYIK